MKKQWWHDKVAYQIYPKSFMDSNGDGIGDLRGIISKLDYLKELGIDILWLSPIYRSPLVDQGYDISNYYAIGEQFGTMEEFDELIAETKKRNMYVLMDLVVNHCSSEHEWFKKAMADPESEYGDYFYIRESKDGQPINNARSYFGGNIWEPIPGTNKYYLHMLPKNSLTSTGRIQRFDRRFTKWSTGGWTKDWPAFELMLLSISKRILIFQCLSRTAWTVLLSVPKPLVQKTGSLKCSAN